MASQSDIILISAIKTGLNYIRQYPLHLDFCFQDALENIVNQQFGQTEINAAKTWFLNTNIPIFSTFRIDKPIYPCVTVQLMSTQESKEWARLGETFGEINDEEISTDGIIVNPNISVGPFSPSYVPSTGIVTLPSGFTTSLIFPGQGLFSPYSTKTYTITQINSSNSFTIATNISDNFANSYVAPAFQTLHVTRNSYQFNEKYEINCIVSGSPGELYWLVSIISYILLQKRQFIFEHNNIQLGTISIGPIEQSTISETENFFQRTISMDGLVEVGVLESLDQHIEGIVPIVNIVDSNDVIQSTLTE